MEPRRDFPRRFAHRTLSAFGLGVPKFCGTAIVAHPLRGTRSCSSPRYSCRRSISGLQGAADRFRRHWQLGATPRHSRDAVRCADYRGLPRVPAADVRPAVRHRAKRRAGRHQRYSAPPIAPRALNGGCSAGRGLLPQLYQEEDWIDAKAAGRIPRSASRAPLGLSAAPLKPALSGGLLLFALHAHEKTLAGLSALWAEARRAGALAHCPRAADTPFACGQSERAVGNRRLSIARARCACALSTERRGLL